MLPQLFHLIRFDQDMIMVWQDTPRDAFKAITITYIYKSIFKLSNTTRDFSRNMPMFITRG